MKRGREVLAKFDNIITYIEKVFKLLPYTLRKRMFVAARNIKGKKGLLLRYILIRTISRKCGKNVTIHEGVFIFYPERIKLGSNVSIHPMCYIDAVGTIDIGSDVSIAHNVTIMSSEHHYNDPNKNIKDQGIYCLETIIQSDVWLGAKAVVLAGVQIKSGSIVAAGAVVTTNVSSNSIVGGIPAKKIKNRI